MKDILPKYFNSQWSFASYQLPTPAKAICGFSPNGGDNAILGKKNILIFIKFFIIKLIFRRNLVLLLLLFYFYQKY